MIYFWNLPRLIQSKLLLSLCEPLFQYWVSLFEPVLQWKKSFLQGLQVSFVSIKPFIKVSIILCLNSKTKKYYHIPQNSPKSHPHDVCCSSVTCSVCTLYWSWLLLSETDAEFWLWPAPVSEPQSRGLITLSLVSPVCVVTASPLLESSVHLVSWRVRAVTFQFIPFM